MLKDKVFFCFSLESIYFSHRRTIRSLLPFHRKIVNSGLWEDKRGRRKCRRSSERLTRRLRRTSHCVVVTMKQSPDALLTSLIAIPICLKKILAKERIEQFWQEFFLNLEHERHRNFEVDYNILASYCRVAGSLQSRLVQKMKQDIIWAAKIAIQFKSES